MVAWVISGELLLVGDIQLQYAVFRIMSGLGFKIILMQFCASSTIKLWTMMPSTDDGFLCHPHLISPLCSDPLKYLPELCPCKCRITYRDPCQQRLFFLLTVINSQTLGKSHSPVFILNYVLALQWVSDNRCSSKIESLMHIQGSGVFYDE